MALANRVAVVTGAARGIGRAIAQRFGREGAHVVAADVDATHGEATAAYIRERGGEATYVSLDASSEESIAECFQTAANRYGTVHILVNNAAAFRFGHLLPAGLGTKTSMDQTLTTEDWEVLWRTNVLGYASCMRHAVKFMLDNPLPELTYIVDEGEGPTDLAAGCRGSIVNVASISASIPQVEFIGYNATKGAILQMSRCAAADFAPHKVRVNTVSPGTIETSASYNHMRRMGVSLREGKDDFASSTMLGRQGAPQEVANAALFLASDEGSFMTAAHIVVDGGATAY